MISLYRSIFIKISCMFSMMLKTILRWIVNDITNMNLLKMVRRSLTYDHLFMSKKNNSHAENELYLLLLLLLPNRYSLFECSTGTDNYNPPETLKYHNVFIGWNNRFFGRTWTVVPSPKRFRLQNIYHINETCRYHEFDCENSTMYCSLIHSQNEFCK